MSEPQQADTEILLRIDDLPPCPRCATTAVLLARFTGAWKNRRGEDVTGLREAVLCPSCAAGSAQGSELREFLAAHEQLDAIGLEQLDTLATAWVDGLRHQCVDQEAVSTQHTHWRNGSL